MDELNFLVGLSVTLFVLDVVLLVKMIDTKHKIVELEMYLVAERSCKDEYLVGWTASNNRIGEAIKILKGGEK